MAGLISFANPITASRKTRATNDSVQACRDKASADLLNSVAMLAANERLILERSAATWSVRAEVLDGLARSTPRFAPGRSSGRDGPDQVRL